MRLQVIVAFVFLLAAAARCAGAAAASGRELSPFVRRNLVEQKQQRKAEFNPARTHYMGRHPRRLADGDCSTNPAICGIGQQCCHAVCVDLSTNPNHCGRCRYQCSFTLGCCAGSCVNVHTDSTNCGACGSSCTTAACSMGLCAYAG